MIIAQAALTAIAWFVMASICTTLSLIISWAFFRSYGTRTLCLSEIQVLLRWRPALLSLLAGFPVAAFVAYIVVALRFGAIQPFNDMHCDATRPIWVRLLSYAGVPLLLAVPSFLLSCATAFVLFHSQQRAYGHFCFPHRDTFTLLPIRRHSRSKRCPLQPIDSFSTPALELKTYPSSDLNLPSDTTSTTHSVTPTPSFTLYAIPSPPSSLSTAPAVLTSGRVPTSPILASHNKRYHLPFSWKPATPSSFEGSRGQERGSRCTQSPSPMTFAPPSTVSSTRTSPISLPVFPGFGRRVSPPMPRGTEERDALQEEMARVVSGCEDLEEDSMGGSLRWARDSEASSFTKSELRFAREDSEGGESGPSRRRSPHDQITWDPALADSPPAHRSPAVWRIVFFQLLLSSTLILAAFSSLIDMFTRHDSPTPFGTQHIALLLAAWAPSIAFGIFPWRRTAHC
ncbi:hypothetical protein AcV5_000305 [Taiwanofungus camphoratus]|nr:hypothetical protein AcV5_000305 [Antrodia cinnamomea]